VKSDVLSVIVTALLNTAEHVCILWIVYKLLAECNTWWNCSFISCHYNTHVFCCHGNSEICASVEV